MTDLVATYSSRHSLLCSDGIKIEISYHNDTVNVKAWKSGWMQEEVEVSDSDAKSLHNLFTDEVVEHLLNLDFGANPNILDGMSYTLELSTSDNRKKTFHCNQLEIGQVKQMLVLEDVANRLRNPIN